MSQKQLLTERPTLGWLQNFWPVISFLHHMISMPLLLLFGKCGQQIFHLKTLQYHKISYGGFVTTTSGHQSQLTVPNLLQTC